MPYQMKWTHALIVVVILLLAACGPASATQPAANPPDAAASATLVQEASATQPPAEPTTAPTNTQVPPTATPLPPTETAAPPPSPTAAILGLAPDGVSGWCLPENVLVSAASDPLKPPERANLGKVENGALEIRNMPFSVCVFLYKFNQPAPAGLKLEIYDLNQKAPWWKVDLLPVNGQPETVYTNLRHTYIVNPPLWNVGYEFAVRDASGKEVTRGKVNLHRWETGLCWQGTLPDPNTLYCPLQQDLHPWDPGYGKVLPTVTPRP
jgi:hypothetical protein